MDKSKVVLIQPTLTSNWVHTEEKKIPIPVGLLSVGTSLRNNNFEVSIIDASIHPDYLVRITEAISQKPILIGISAMTSQVPNAYRISEMIKNTDKSIPIIWGGIHPSLFPKQTCQSQYADFVCYGEGEKTCIELANALKESTSFKHIKGLVYKDSGNIIVNPSRELLDINSLPFLNYGLLDIENYLKRDYGYSKFLIGKFLRTVSILTGLGCVYNCSFCINELLYGERRHRAKTASNILNEIEYVMKKYDVGCIHIRDENFLVNKKRLFEFLDGIEERNLKFKWFCLGRIEYINDNYINDAVLERMIRLGCIRISFGIESGSEKVLRILNKDTKLKQIYKGVEILKGHKNLWVGASFMMAMPGEDEKDVLQTVKLIKKLKSQNPRFLSVGPLILMPYPGAPLTEECKKKGFVEPSSLEEWAQTDYEKIQFTGYTGIKSLSWIKSPQMITLVNFYSRILDFSKFRYLPVKLYWLKAIEVLRCSVNFWRFPLELKIWELLPGKIKQYTKKAGMLEEEVFQKAKKVNEL